jgi:hypothetical protein
LAQGGKQLNRQELGNARLLSVVDCDSAWADANVWGCDRNNQRPFPPQGDGNTDLVGVPGRLFKRPALENKTSPHQQKEHSCESQKDRKADFVRVQTYVEFSQSQTASRAERTGLELWSRVSLFLSLMRWWCGGGGFGVEGLRRWWPRSCMRRLRGSPPKISSQEVVGSIDIF